MAPQPAAAHFLGLELATDQLRATVVDDQLDIVGVECVDFDSELPEFQTQGGIFTTPSDAYTTPVEMWVKALDILLEKLHKNFDLSKIKAIGGSAQQACVWWRNTSLASLARLDAEQALHAQLGNFATLPNTPVAQDTSTMAQAQALEAALGSTDAFVARTGVLAHASLPAAHILRIRESQRDVWTFSSRVTLASTFLASLFLGSAAPTSEAEACAMGLWIHGAAGSGVSGRWDDLLLDIIGGSNEEGARLRLMLGEVDLFAGGRKIGHIAPYFVRRYGFSSDTILTTFTSDYLSTFLSLCPSPTDVLLSFGPMDTMLIPAAQHIPSRLYTLFPHPMQDPSEKRKYVAVLTSRNGDVPRALVRDMYTKSWSAFDRLIAVVPPGGSIGLDDKLFSFWLLQGDVGTPSGALVKGIFRFETGIKVHEFRDLRANPRCLVESQLLALRVRYARMRGSRLFPPSTRSPSRNGFASTLDDISVSLPFDPYLTAPLPKRIFVTGAAANFPSIANLVGDIFNAPIFMPATQLDSAQHTPHRNAPAPGCVARAALGGAYAARWVWGRERGRADAGRAEGGVVGFEDEVKRLLTKRWIASGGTNPRTAAKQGTSGSSSPAPYQRGSGLGNTPLVEEDEEEEAFDPRIVGLGASSINPGLGMSGYQMFGNEIGIGGEGLLRVRNPTTSSIGTTISSTNASLTGTASLLGQTPSSTFTTPDLSMLENPGPLSAVDAPPSSATPVGITPLTPVAPLPTSDAEAQLGLSKVAEPDTDAFMAYASLVPEFCRLEGLLAKSLV